MKQLFKGVIQEKSRIRKLPRILREIMKGLRAGYGNNIFCEVLLLKSEEGDPRQRLHADNHRMARPEICHAHNVKPIVRYSDMTFSMLLAFEDKTSWINDKDETIDIAENGICLWRGNYLHAGAAYKAQNYRIFFAFGRQTSIVEKNIDYNTGVFEA